MRERRDRRERRKWNEKIFKFISCPVVEASVPHWHHFIAPWGICKCSQKIPRKERVENKSHSLSFLLRAFYVPVTHINLHTTVNCLQITFTIYFHAHIKRREISLRKFQFQLSFFSALGCGWSRQRFMWLEYSSTFQPTHLPEVLLQFSSHVARLHAVIKINIRFVCKMMRRMGWKGGESEQLWNGELSTFRVALRCLKMWKRWEEAQKVSRSAQLENEKNVDMLSWAELSSAKRDTELLRWRCHRFRRH